MAGSQLVSTKCLRALRALRVHWHAAVAGIKTTSPQHAFPNVSRLPENTEITKITELFKWDRVA
jgi:hypothetical protein